MILQSSSSSASGRSKWVLVAAAFVPLVIIAVVVGIIVVVSNHKSSSAVDVAASTNCLGKQFSVGSSGTCVQDIQTMINFIETDGLTQCPFVDAATLPMTDYYDSQVATQVKTVQDWVTCYDKEEGVKPPQFKNGVVTQPLWTELCTYAYLYPSQNSNTKSSYRTQALAAGKHAGCASVAQH